MKKNQKKVSFVQRQLEKAIKTVLYRLTPYIPGAVHEMENEGISIAENPDQFWDVVQKLQNENLITSGVEIEDSAE